MSSVRSTLSNWGLVRSIFFSTCEPTHLPDPVTFYILLIFFPRRHCRTFISLSAPPPPVHYDVTPARRTNESGRDSASSAAAMRTTVSGRWSKAGRFRLPPRRQRRCGDGMGRNRAGRMLAWRRLWSQTCQKLPKLCPTNSFELVQTRPNVSKLV